MRRVHIVGRKNHGKTTLIVELIEEFARRGIRVGTVKHSAHVHDLDTPGKDSHRQRQAGASPAAVVTRDSVGMFFDRLPGDGFYDQLAPLFAEIDLVLVEGHIESDAVKIEVWREAISASCLARQHNNIAAVVTDDEPHVNIPVYPRRSVARVADHILQLLDMEHAFPPVPDPSSARA